MSDLKREYPDPSESDLVDPAFEAIWQAIKGWDLSREQADGMYSGATGNDVMHILNALRKVVPAEPEQECCRELRRLKPLAAAVVEYHEGWPYDTVPPSLSDRVDALKAALKEGT